LGCERLARWPLQLGGQEGVVIVHRDDTNVRGRLAQHGKDGGQNVPGGGDPAEEVSSS
jgi:hypothetical protein